MDAQNAAQSDQTKPAGASPQRSGTQPTAAASSTPAPLSPKHDAIATPEKDTRHAVDASKPADAESLQDRDSDAETIVLPGKDGHSPSKARKVRQEDKSDGDGDAAKDAPKAPASHDGDKATVPSRLIDGIKKKRLAGHLDKDKPPRSKDGSSGLSSAPASPPQQRQHRRRSDDPRSSSDSEYSHHKPSSKSSLRDKLKSGERLLPHKRKATKPDSDDEADVHKARRQRTIGAGIDSGRAHKDHKPSTSSRPHHENRSISPPVRSHRRSVSTQLQSQSSNGIAQKKKRLPPPLQSTGYHSDESSASGSPHPRSSKLRSLATPATADSNVSPAKIAPHKKHLDAHGQTFLARACARGEYEIAKQRLGERPEDLNVADYAGNTPLQIAAINGCEDIVKLLIDAGCNLDCVNYDKDTPLLDAVDNGHLSVVKLLLDAGVNPRKANVNGEEPIDRVTDETENAAEIRAALTEAKKRAGERRRTSEDRHSHHDYHEPRDSHAPESPRQSPATAMVGFGRRGGTVRSTKTRPDLLYMPLDEKTLRQAAGRGDEETVARILQVKEGYDDPESMVAAARGGHDLVIQLLLGLGGANPDPAPVPSLQPEFATPILAAIGQENIKVIELLLEQQGFDPTRKFKGQTYYEIAGRRQGTNWKEEEDLLKNAFDDYKRSHKESNKTKSPSRREREREREDRDAKRAKRAQAKEEARLQKRHLSSPARDLEPKKKPTSSKITSPKDKRRSNSFTNHSEEQSMKRGPGRPRKEERIPSINVSDRELSPTMAHKQLKAKRAESDAAGVSSEGETHKPRRKLVSKGELRGEREKQRRASMASNASSAKDRPMSPHDSRHDDADKHKSDKLSEKYHDRTKALKRDESRDRLSVSGEGSTKRHRNSITPDRPSNGDKDDGEIPVKRRRLDTEHKEKRQRPTASSDERPRKASVPRDTSGKSLHKNNHKDHDEERKEARRDLNRRDSGRSNESEKSIHVKSEDTDVEMRDVDLTKAADNAETQALAEKEAQEERQRHEAEEKARREEEEKEREKEQQRLEEEKKKRKLEQEETRKREEAEKKRKEEADRKRKEEEEEQRKRQEEEERQKREAKEKARREEEEKRRLEDEKRKKEEEEKRQREEEERLHREQLEREAAEEARREREEEERKERERRERAHRDELERKRAAREAEQKRIREEQEQARLDKLPPLLRWLDTCPNPKLPGIAEIFKNMQGARYDTIRPETNGTLEGREQWVLNTHVALLLGEKDLDLSRCKSIRSLYFTHF